MLINYVPGEECRIAIVEDGKLEEFYHERASTESHVNNIYKGVVTNVEPAIQAAFVDFGLEQNGFLHVTDVHPKYFPGADKDETEKIGKKTGRRDRPPIEKCFKRGSKVVVQVLKEGIGTKGPTVTSYCSIPGRFLVMMPDMERHGVSRKTEDEDARKEMRDILKTLDPPDGFGFIVRTAGLGQTKTDLKRDMAYLLRLWKDIEKSQKSIRKKTGELYTESDLVIRTLRDVFTPDIERVILDDPEAAQRAHAFLAVANPRSKSKVVLYDDPVPMFHRFGVEQQIDHIGARTVPLPSGGALVIDPTEALVAIDVNSGKSRKAKDAESNAYQTNQEAIDEIARQLRLRDLGGLVVLDLIDMMQAKHRKSIESRLRNLLKNDRARTRVGSISQFGMLEMSRQRMRPSLKKTIFRECSHCEGHGYSKSAESVVLQVMRELSLVMHREDVATVELTISPDVAFHILNRKRGELVRLEHRHGKGVTVRVGGGRIDFVKVTAFNKAGTALPEHAPHDPKKIAKPTDTTFRELTREELKDLIADLEQLEAEDAALEAKAAEAAAQPTAEKPSEATENEASDDTEEGGKKKRRRRRRGGRGRNKSKAEGDEQANTETDAATADDDPASKDEAQSSDVRGDKDQDPASTEASDEDAPKKKRRRRRRRKKPSGESELDEMPEKSGQADDKKTTENPAENAEANSSGDTPDGDEAPKKKRRRRRRSKKKTGDAEGQADSSDDASGGEPSDAPAAGYSNTVVEAGA